MKNFKNSNIASVVILLVIAAMTVGLVIWAQSTFDGVGNNDNTQSSSENANDNDSEGEMSSQEYNLIVKTDEESTKEYTLPRSASDSESPITLKEVMILLQEDTKDVGEEEKFSFGTEEFEFGEYLTVVNGVESVNGENFWEIVVNDIPASQGITDLIVTPDDEVTLQLTSLD